MKTSKVWVVIRSVVDDKGGVVEAERYYLEREPLEGFPKWCATQENVVVREYTFRAFIYPDSASLPLDDLKGRFVFVGKREGIVDKSSDVELTIRLWPKPGPLERTADEVVTIPRSDPSWRLKYPRKP